MVVLKMSSSPEQVAVLDDRGRSHLKRRAPRVVEDHRPAAACRGGAEGTVSCSMARAYTVGRRSRW